MFKLTTFCHILYRKCGVSLCTGQAEVMLSHAAYNMYNSNMGNWAVGSNNHRLLTIVTCALCTQRISVTDVHMEEVLLSSSDKILPTNSAHCKSVVTNADKVEDTISTSVGHRLLTSVSIACVSDSVNWHLLITWMCRIQTSVSCIQSSYYSLTHSLTSRPSSMRVGDSRWPLRYLSSPLCSIYYYSS